MVAVVPACVHEVCPRPADRFEQLYARVWAAFDVGVLELVERRTAWLLGDTAEGPIATVPGSFERAGVDLAEQMVIDVSGVTPRLLSGVAEHVGEARLRDFVTSVFVIEFSHRLRAIATALLPVAQADPTGTWAEPGSETIRELVDQYAAAVMRTDQLDPVTTELVRLRCARTHHCRICQTLRLADARDAGVDDSMTDKIDDYERSDLPERAKLALRITDAMIGLPGELTSETIAHARRLFTPAELAELCLDIVKWSVQKVHVATGTDGADGVEVGTALSFGDDGRPAPFR
jgi:alkylhydroperoxidase family enzyme